jgi:hypothetical protein
MRGKTSVIFQFLPLALTWIRDAAMSDNLRQQDPK